MAKKTRKEKELAQLRRKAEVLRAQLKGSRGEQKQQESLKPQSTNNKVQKEEIQRVNPKYIKEDLIKAGILTAIAIGIVFAFYVLKGQIPFL